MSISHPCKWYFAYGSNLSPTQMASRCPASKPLALAYLPGYSFIINERHYANIVPHPPTTTTAATAAAAATNEFHPGVSDSITDALSNESPGPRPGVFGVLYSLPPMDEATLDGHEGVPFAYEKEVMRVDVFDAQVPALVYIDRKRTGHSTPLAEYVDRMNRGVDEAGYVFDLPEWYVRDVIRQWIPAPKQAKKPIEDDEALSKSKQA